MTEIDQGIKDLVVARLKTRSSDVGVSIGGAGEYTREDLIRHVEAGDDIGKKLIEVEMRFLRAIKTGELYKLLDADEDSTHTPRA